MKTDTHSDKSVDRGHTDRHAVEHSFVEDALQKSIDLGVVEWEEETEDRFFACQHVLTN